MLGLGKASKCKKLLKKVRCRLDCLRKERSTICTQLQEELEKLDHHALDLRIEQEQHIRDESSAYNLLDHFCNLILRHFFYIRTHKSCRKRDLAEAVSCLAFASSRLRSRVIPELDEIRDLFGERYGESFVETAVKLLPGNLVNPTFKKSILALFPADSVVPDELVFKSSDEISDERSSSAEKKDDEETQLITFQSAKHVHPKLPEWDDVFTKFSALKKPENVNPKLPEYDDITAKLNAFKIAKNENSADNNHGNIDDGALFSLSWLIQGLKSVIPSLPTTVFHIMTSY